MITQLKGLLAVEPHELELFIWREAVDLAFWYCDYSCGRSTTASFGFTRFRAGIR